MERPERERTLGAFVDKGIDPMPNETIVHDGDRFLLTQRGVEAIRNPGKCLCVYEVQGPYLVCVYCETTYGLARSSFGGASRDFKR